MRHKERKLWDLGWWTKKLDILRVVFLGWWPRLPREWLLLQLGSHGSIRRASVADPLDFLFSLGSSSAAAGAFTIISHLWQHHFAASAFAGNETHPFEKPTDATVNVWQPWRILWLDDFIVAASCFINLTVVAIPSPSIPMHPKVMLQMLNQQPMSSAFLSVKYIPKPKSYPGFLRCLQSSCLA